MQTISKTKYEIIVVDDGSQDNTGQLMQVFKLENPAINIVYIKQKQQGPSRARNAGLKSASGKIIFFTDDDCVVPYNWIETLNDAYRKYPEIAGAGGWYNFEQNHTQRNIIVKYFTHWLNQTYGESIKRENIYIAWGRPGGNTANMSYLKSALEEIGGFDETFDAPGFDDWDLKKRVIDAGYPLAYLPCMVTTIKPLDFKSLIKRWYKFGRGRYKFVNKHPDLYLLYYPSFRNQVIKKIKNTEAKQLWLKFFILLDFMLTRLGWEYQKFIESKGLTR